MSSPYLNLAPLRLGGVAIDFPVALAAMSGYSDWPTRAIARRMGQAARFAKSCSTSSSST